MQPQNSLDLLQEPVLLLIPSSRTNAHIAARNSTVDTPEDGNTTILNTRTKRCELAFQHKEEKIIRISASTAPNGPDVCSSGRDCHKARPPSCLKAACCNRGKRLGLSIWIIDDLPLWNKCLSIGGSERREENDTLVGFVHQSEVSQWQPGSVHWK